MRIIIKIALRPSAQVCGVQESSVHDRARTEGNRRMRKGVALADRGRLSMVADRAARSSCRWTALNDGGDSGRLAIRRRTSLRTRLLRVGRGSLRGRVILLRALAHVVDVDARCFCSAGVHARMPAHVALDTEATATAFVRTCECCRAARQTAGQRANHEQQIERDTHASRPCEC